MLDRKTAVLACSIVAAAGSLASAQVTVDGKATAGDNYGAAKWVQTVPTSISASFGDNIAGMGDQGALVVGDPTIPNTGVEIAIPYSALGLTSGFTSIKMQVFISNNFGDNLSNQNLPGLVLNTANLGYSRTVNFANIAGDQYFSAMSVSNITTAETIDGSRASAGDSYPAASGSRTQTNSTGYGDAGHGQVVFAGSFGPDGSELDAVLVRRNDTTQTLYVMLTGNLQANGNRVNLFFDTAAGGQNTIVGTTGAPLEGFGTLNADPGLTFDAAFSPDYVVSVNASRTTQPPNTPEANDQYLIYVDYAQLVTGVPGTNVYCGSTVYPGVAGFSGGTLSGGDAGAPAIKAAINNSNTAGVVGGQVGGDFRAPNLDYAYGSEIDAVYSKIESGKLYVLVTGNLNTTYAKLNLFFDCQDGGQNRLRGSSQGAVNYVGNPDIDYNGLNRMGADTLGTDEFGNPVPANGVKFDDGFTADYWLVCTTGPRAVGAGSSPYIQAYANAAVLRTSGMRQDFNGRAQDYGAYDGGRKHPDNFPMDFDGPQFDAYASSANIYCNYAPRIAAAQAAQSLQPLPFKIRMAIDNSNVDGVTTTDASGAATVTTGAEIEIDLAELIDGGWDGVTPIKVAGFISNEGPALNGDRYNYVANQVLGGLPLSGGTAADLGDPRTIDFSAIAGNQFVVLTSAALCSPADIGVQGGVPGHDNLLDNNDFIVFIDYFFNNNPIADVGVQGGVPGTDGLFDNNDFIVFIDQFFNGQPNCHG